MRDPFVPFVVAPAELSRRNVSAMVEVAQVPGSKLIDFRDVSDVPPELFGVLAHRWRVPGGLVPRLAFVFPFQHYAIARDLARTTIVTLAKRGTSFRLFYAAQRVHDWVRGLAVGDDVAGALLDLETTWSGANADAVLDGALHLVRTTGSMRRAALLVRLAWIARRQGGAERAAAIAREAITVVGDARDREACEIRRQALRALAGALFELGDEVSARALFGEAAGIERLAQFVEMGIDGRPRE
ncbi:MAG TPA: hypothetical protein VGL61_23885 [Kofleriaceae bacterium]|jgi:hypothetical protein